MKQVIEKVLLKIGVKSERSFNIGLHVFWSALYKFGGLLFTIVLIPISCEFLKPDEYGVWLTIGSLITWISFFEVGLGNGLRNKLAEAYAINDIGLIKGYVSTAYISISAFCLGGVVLFCFIQYYIDWIQFFNAKESMRCELSLLMPVIFVLFSLQMILKLIITIHTAKLNHSISNKFFFLTQLFTFIGIVILNFYFDLEFWRLLVFGLIFSLVPFLILVVFNLYLI